MFDNDNIIISPTTITIYIHPKMHIHQHTLHKYILIIIQFKELDQLDSSAINGPTEQNTVDYIERQWNWEIGLKFLKRIFIW